jgi:hypothetical protein
MGESLYDFIPMDEMVIINMGCIFIFPELGPNHLCIFDPVPPGFCSKYLIKD